MSDYRIDHVRVFDSDTARKAHLVAVDADSGDPAVCGQYPVSRADLPGRWSGTGGVDDWRRANVELPLCKRCREATA